ncbi:2-oxoglutarate dehydrogenase E1 component [Cohnella sp. GCM10012308]|uniref:2-oxoglutarate dehydrogenase E1 component n=1 Tax=Cohnella sp. GCM10012308 TaxID=3317329 RepID=UPI00360D4290
MANGEQDHQNPWAKYYGPNLGYIEEQYELYLRDPESVAQEYREQFKAWGEPPRSVRSPAASAPGAVVAVDVRQLRNAVLAGKLVWNVRAYGHLVADIDPLDIGPVASSKVLEPETYGLTYADLAALPADLVWEGAPAGVSNGAEAIAKLKEVYGGTIAYEFSHIADEEERQWLNNFAEQRVPAQELSAAERADLLKRLLEAELFEDFLQKTFIGVKRFSVEGNDALIALVDRMVKDLSGEGVSDIAIGMAHRGRLNVLAHILQKPLTKIFAEFQHSASSGKKSPTEGSFTFEPGGTGDVKYHLGARTTLKNAQGGETRVVLANNPSHLEYVNPVVQGFARAAQDDRTQRGYPIQKKDVAASIVMHGDAAFPGEGIVTETMNLSTLRAYGIGGTIHIIVNNKIGFTTDSVDSRSTQYSSDPAKGFEIPIVHVNADDPEAVIAIARMAVAYRQRFKKDFLIDLIGFRRHGHNETLDPEPTQPTVYKKVKAHPGVSRVYANRLVKEGKLTEAQFEEAKNSVLAVFKAAYEEMKGLEDHHEGPQSHAVEQKTSAASAPTNVPLAKLRELNAGLLKWPEGFKLYPKLQKILERRATSLNDGEKIDWSHAETLAFASILADGRAIRMTGQDAETATFAQRNLVLHDIDTGDTFCPMHTLPQAKASFALHNSPLSESAVLGFEYGYNVYSPETMVLWEAQFGDFVNVAQVLIDQFISSGKAKWSERSSLVMLLPHSYEGQGPEHSSARLERFLQLSAEDNWTVANLSSAAQYFHLLRRQAAITGTDEAKPLVVMTPKSLLRNPRATSPAAELGEGGFKTILEQAGLGAKPDRVERIVLCSGKVAIDLEDALTKDKDSNKDWLHIIRVEQLYPFPAEEIKKVFARFPKLKEVVWTQEEPRNMGAWTFMESRIREIAPTGAEVKYIGRPDRASPATGFADVHADEQSYIVTQSLKQSPTLTHNLGR